MTKVILFIFLFLISTISFAGKIPAADSCVDGTLVCGSETASCPAPDTSEYTSRFQAVCNNQACSEPNKIFHYTKCFCQGSTIICSRTGDFCVKNKLFCTFGNCPAPESIDYTKRFAAVCTVNEICPGVDISATRIERFKGDPNQPFPYVLRVSSTNKCLIRYADSCNIELTDSKDYGMCSLFE
jgi:hypothetical protein